jgi:hypothetical protein
MKEEMMDSLKDPFDVPRGLGSNLHLSNLNSEDVPLFSFPGLRI